MSNFNENKLILVDGHLGIEKVKNILSEAGVNFERNNRITFLDGWMIHVESHRGAYWKEYVRGRMFSEIIMVESAFKNLDNDDKTLLLSRFRKDIHLSDRSSLLRQLKNVVTRSRILKELSSLVGNDYEATSSSWVEGFEFPICDYRAGMAQYFLDANNPTKEEFETAKFAIGGQYRS